jgi:salicylate biosynthesis isochorismate synthase
MWSRSPDEAADVVRLPSPRPGPVAANREPLLFRTETCGPVDPLHVFAAAGRARRFYWEQPTAGRYRVGVGCTERLVARGPDRFVRIEAAAADLFARLAWEGDGPRVAQLVGGFAFSAGGTGAAPWQGFPDAELRLPDLLHARDGDAHWRQACAASAWSGLEIEPPRLGQPVRGSVEINSNDARGYKDCVRRALAEIDAGRIDKVVVARAARIQARSAIDAVAWLFALRERFPGCTLFAVGEGDSVFLGASPERLVRLSGDTVESAAIAGTAPRGSSRAADQAIGEALRQNAKNNAEHAIVVRHLVSVLSECCDTFEVDPAPRLLKTRTVQHLFTGLRARRRAEAPVSLLQLVERLHPTPAVGGTPREAALAWLAAHEPVARGWFAGPVGFLQSDGDGEFVVALRSALVHGHAATAWAGAGIVAGSEPDAEFTETELKLRTVLGPLLWGAP